jgi:hypothetical protein
VSSLDVSPVAAKFAPSQEPWYGIRTRSRHERLVADLLTRKGQKRYLRSLLPGGSGLIGSILQSVEINADFTVSIEVPSRHPC